MFTYLNLPDNMTHIIFLENLRLSYYMARSIVAIHYIPGILLKAYEKPLFLESTLNLALNFKNLMKDTYETSHIQSRITLILKNNKK